MIDQTGTATPSTETPEAAVAAETAHENPEPTDDDSTSDNGGAQVDLDRVAEPDPAAAPDAVGEIPPADDAPPDAPAAPTEPAVDTVEAAVVPAEPALDTVRPAVDTVEPLVDTPQPAVDTAEPAAAPVEPAVDTAPTEADATETVAAIPAGVPVMAGPRTVGRLVADVLRAAGVRYAFTVPGESFLGLLEGLTGAGIRVVATRHEGAASFMAEAYGQLTGRPAACLATRAVGAANLAIGIHTARQNSTPMFVVVGQVERRFQGREAFQEVDQVGSFGRLAKWSAEPRDPVEVAGALREAVGQALGGRPGPVLLSIAEDLLDEEVAADLTVDLTRPGPPRADVPDVRAVLQLLASAERPVILAGAGVLRARTSSDLTRFAELLHVPVIAAWRRGDVISNDHALYLGMAGYGSPPSVRERLERADAMLVIGSRLNEVTTFGYRIPAAGVPWAHVDLAPRDGRDGLEPPTIAVRSDARAFLRAAVQRLRGAVLHAGLVDARRAVNERDRAAWERDAAVDSGNWSGPGIHPGRAIATLRRVLPDEAIVTTDAGNFGGWAARGFRFRRPGTFLGPTSGAMGYGLPAAIAAALVHRDRPVVALVGDGGLAMSMAELETAVREHARVVVVAFDNERYGTIRMHQESRADTDPVGTDLGPIDFAAVARACGARGVRIDSDDGFEPALRQALAGDRPTVIQLALDRRWVSVDQPAVR
ncbi:MAG TPA: thiamine pyrophosphate-dependent enzyme [Candidatus Limnocylindrales bacterium]|jgi:acetolactate synthase-1/2/3 large subunit|nr:thiamine pyrophosphate-dependent enzyme [Candidatus Limnocylindrales bacterium]